MNKLQITIFSLAALALVATACGDDDDSSGRDPRDSGAGSGGPRPAGSSGAGSGGGRRDAATPDDAAVPSKDAGNDAALGSRVVTIRFVPRVGTTHFACGLDYPNQGSTGATVTATDFRFYVQDLSLIAPDGTAVAVELEDRSPWQAAEGVAFVDFENDTGACTGTPETNDVITGTVPQGRYAGVSFAVGVPESLNHGNPPDLPAPLQAGGMQWSWLTGFRFMKAEVKQVLEDDIDGGAIAGVGLCHPGATACRGNPGAGTVVCDRPNRSQVRLASFDPDGDAIAVDLGAIFAQSDLASDSQCHSGADACGPMFQQLGIDYATGEPLTAQHVFHVE